MCEHIKCETMIYPKCKYDSGDSWEQCNKNCPMVMLPWDNIDISIIYSYMEMENLTNKDLPYIETTITKIEKQYNPEYGDDRICECEHPYYRHFDTYENMYNCGCKYCECNEFKEKINGRYEY